MSETNEQIAQKLWQKFSKEKIAVIKKIPLGLRNTSFYIKSKTGKEFVLKLYVQNFLTEPEIEEIARIVKKLEEAGRPVLEMILGLNGNFVQKIMVNRQIFLATLSKYAETSFSEVHVNRNIIINTAKELRFLHRELNKIPHINTFKSQHTKAQLKSFLEENSIKKIEGHFQNAKQRSVRFNEFLKFYMNEGNTLLKYFDSKKEENFQLNHGDFSLNNFLIKDGKILKIFDFDELIMAPQTFEIAISIYYLDYAEEFYTDELLEIFLKTYYGKLKITLEIVEEVLYFMKYRAFHRLARYFTYFQFTDRPGGHFTKFRRILEKFGKIDPHEVYKIIKT